MKSRPKSPSAKGFAMNSSWTNLPGCRGWRHYRVAGRRYIGSTLQLEMMSVCDRAVRFWLDAAELKTSEDWVTGWQS